MNVAAKRPNPDWPDDMVAFMDEALSRKWPGTLSASGVAKAINADPRWSHLKRKTRLSIIGKAHRVGAAGRQPYVNRPGGGSMPDKEGSIIDWSPRADQIMRNMPNATCAEVASKINAELDLSVNPQHVAHRRRKLNLARVVVRKKPDRSVLHGYMRERHYDMHVKLPLNTESPNTSVALTDVTHDRASSTCMWPVSEDITDMKVCGSAVKIGAYCAHHAGRAYSQMPTKKRNATFHRVNQFDCKELELL